MTAVIVDTDVVSMIFKRDTRAAWYEPHLVGKLLAISFMTRAELSLWPRSAGWGEQKIATLERFLRDSVVLPYDEDLCELWAEIKFSCQRKGREVSHSDAWIAATALLYDLPLVTHNYHHFAGVEGLRVISKG